MKPVYNRVLLKVSGEALAGEQRFGINEEMTRKVSAVTREEIIKAANCMKLDTIYYMDKEAE